MSHLSGCLHATPDCSLVSVCLVDDCVIAVVIGRQVSFVTVGVERASGEFE